MKTHKRRSAQAIIELALVAPVLLILLMLIVQYSIIMNATVSLTNLSREGARFAATQPSSDAAIKNRMQQVCPSTIHWADIQNNIVITPAENSTNPPRSRSQLIQVQITYDMRNKLFLPASFFGVPIFNQTYVTMARMMIE